PTDILDDAGGMKIKSSMSAPLFVAGEFRGLINLDSRENDVFDETDRALVEYVRTQVPIAIGMFEAYGRARELLSEKELILREVHHRLKNNMGAINSILSLQSRTIGDPSARQALEDAGNRVQSMMVLYDRLYKAKGFRTVSSAQILPDLVEEILENYGPAVPVETRLEIEDFELDAELLQPLGIIVNEILTNVAKYAFAGRDRGRIDVKAARKGNRIRVEIADDGIGMPESVDLGHSTGFGLMLIESMAKQLESSVRIIREGGTRFIIEFSA
ncbi:MAG: histidine kinase dimerization/phosphoacceptor domain -containing protein, partial [Spirochaetaceae bacterium]|nr:histidine kinase dimerization/phosphoacceptor domain -containing protein [Spirochaetaceae bacterium]